MILVLVSVLCFDTEELDGDFLPQLKAKTRIISLHDLKDHNFFNMIWRFWARKQKRANRYDRTDIIKITEKLII